MKMKEHHGAKVKVTKDGPYLVSGGVPLGEQWIETNAAGESLDYRKGKTYPTLQQYALCRCGQSGSKPFCDGTHKLGMASGRHRWGPETCSGYRICDAD
jgi:CDGSH-type Zn-finger protein